MEAGNDTDTALRVRLVEVHPDMMGTISYQHVEDGVSVQKGEPIVEIECMKTLMGVKAPVAGVVRHKRELGEMVGPDDVIAVIEVA